MKGRVKKYVQAAIPAKFSEKGGFSARFVSDGFSVDAKAEILPGVIKDEGLQIGAEPGWALVRGFIKGCADHVAKTGETVSVGSLMTFGLGIRGWYARKTSKATKENVHVTCKLLDDLRPTCDFSMSNANEGNTLTLVTVMSPGCKLDEVVQGTTARINGKWLKLLDDGTGEDYVLAEAKNAAGEKVSAKCAVIESDDDHIDVTVPSVFGDAAFVGKTIMFTVFGRTGDPEAGVQDASIEATLLAGAAPVPPPTGHATLVGVTTSPDDGPDELSIADGLCLVFDKADPEGATGHLVVNGVVQGCPVTVDTAMGGAMWEFGREELVGQSVNFKFRYEDGTEVGNVTKTIRAGK